MVYMQNSEKSCNFVYNGCLGFCFTVKAPIYTQYISFLFYGFFVIFHLGNPLAIVLYQLSFPMPPKRVPIQIIVRIRVYGLHLSSLIICCSHARHNTRSIYPIGSPVSCFICLNISSHTSTISGLRLELSIFVSKSCLPLNATPSL